MAKRLTVVVLGLVLAGCGVAPTAPRAEEVEKKVALKRGTSSSGTARPAALAPAASAPAARFTPPAVRTSAPLPAAGPAQASSTRVGAANVAGAPARAAAATLAVVKTPASVRVFPARFPDGGVADLKFDPEEGRATWTVEAAGSPVRLARVGLTASGDGPGAQPIAAEIAAGLLGWPAEIAGEAELSLPLAINAVTKVVSEAGTRTCRLALVLQGEDGKPLQDPEGRPVALTLAMQVL